MRLLQGRILDDRDAREVDVAVLDQQPLHEALYVYTNGRSAKRFPRARLEILLSRPSTQPPKELRGGKPGAAGQGPAAYLPTIFDLVGSLKNDSRPNQVNVMAAWPSAKPSRLVVPARC